MTLPKSALYVGAILAYAAFLYSGTNGDLWIHGDDVWFLSRFTPPGETYLERMSLRYYLTPFYTWVWDAVGHDSARMHRFFFLLHVLAGLFAFFSIRPALGQRGAAFAAMCLLSYTGTGETVTWLSAGGYLIVLIALLASVWIACSAVWGPWRRALAISAINWPAVHLYELGIAAAPLYPLLWLLWRRRCHQPVTIGGLVPKLLPLAMFSLHWSLMYAATPSERAYYWMRNSLDTSASSLLKKLFSVLELGLDASVGPRFIVYTRYYLESFATLVSLTPVLVATAFAAAAGLWWVYVQNGQRPDTSSRLLVVLGSLFLWLFTPAVGLTIVTSYMPPRLLTFAAVGVAILFGWIADLRPANPAMSRAIGLGAVCLLSLQALAFHGMVRANHAVWQFDSSIRSQTARLFKLAAGDAVFLSMPVQPGMLSGWRGTFSQFDTGHILPLLIYDSGFTTPVIHSQIRYASQLRWDPGEPIALPFDMAEKTKGVFYPLYLRHPDNKLFGIRRLNLVDTQGRVLRSLDVSAFSGHPSAQTVEASVRPASLSGMMVQDEPRQIVFHHFDPSYDLEIGGPVITTAIPFDVEAVQDGVVVSRHRFNASGWTLDFRVPLSAVDPSKPLLLRNSAPGAVWRAEKLGFAPTK